jgi:cholesterol oxidase
MSTSYDVIIIGSGFGGSVMAARLGAALPPKPNGPARVLVLERGQDHSGRLDAASEGPPVNSEGNRFRQSLDPSQLARVTELYTDPTGAFRPGVSSLNVLAGKGFGGGSIAYDGVSLRAPTSSFDEQRDGRRLWPAVYSRAALDPYYAVVERALKVKKLAWTDRDVPHWQLATKRDFVFAEACRRIGATAAPLKLADDRDRNEGWWNQGQRFEGRQDLTKNYLAAAKASGAELWSGCEVTSIAPTKAGYVVTMTDTRRGGARTVALECRLVVVAGGAIPSTALLLRSAEGFTGARDLDPGGQLGKRLSGNGDYGVTGVVGDDFEVEGFKGKPMSSFCPSFFAKDKFILIPFHADALFLALGQPSTLLRAADASARGRGRGAVAAGPDGAPERDWGAAYKARLAKFGRRVLTMGCLAVDDGEGEIRLGSRGPEVVWPKTSDRTEARWSAALTAMQRLYEALGGEMFMDSYRKDGTVSTAHPLGGCRMTERDGRFDGVVDALGESLTNPNLFVVDGAVIPAALGVNPSLTIAAVAESIADRLVNGRGTKALSDRLA